MSVASEIGLVMVWGVVRDVKREMEKSSGSATGERGEGLGGFGGAVGRPLNDAGSVGGGVGTVEVCAEGSMCGR